MWLVTMYFFSSYPERDELKSIYSIYMSSILGLCLPKHEIWKSSTKVANLTGSMIKIYEEVLADFLYVWFDIWGYILCGTECLKFVKFVICKWQQRV
jgi:hypothetical protein